MGGRYNPIHAAAVAPCGGWSGEAVVVVHAQARPLSRVHRRARMTTIVETHELTDFGSWIEPNFNNSCCTSVPVLVRRGLLTVVANSVYH